MKSALQVAVVAALLWVFVFQVSVVLGHSMDPGIEPGDRLVVDKLSLHWRPVRRFDVIVFRCPTDPDDDYVKRVVGLSGETVELRAGDLYVDGEIVPQEFELVKDEDWHGPVKVPEGEYFVLGDNRPRSRDSRGLGTIDGDAIRGVVRFRVYPFDRAGRISK